MRLSSLAVARSWTRFASASASCTRHGVPITDLAEGRRRGSDWWAALWRKESGVSAFKADWAHHGNAAGPIRNRQRIEEGKPGTAISFVGREERSNSMLSQARIAYLEIIQG